MRTYQFGIAIALVALLSACARTSMTSQVNPQYRGYRFSKVLVVGVFEDLELRTVAEDKLCEKLNVITNCKGVRSVDVLFPGRQYSRDEVASILQRHGIGGVLILAPTNSGVSSEYFQGMSFTTGSGVRSGNVWTGSSTTTTFGGSKVTKPWASYQATLYSLAEGDVVWYATAQTKGSEYANWKDLIRSAAGTAVNQLEEAGLLGASGRRH